MNNMGYRDRFRGRVFTAAKLACVGLYLVYLNFAYFENFELPDTVEPWWPWELASEGTVNTPEPVSWKVADNSLVMKAIDMGPEHKQAKDAKASSSGLSKKVEEKQPTPMRKKHVLFKPIGQRSDAKTLTILVMNDSKKPVENSVVISESECGGKCVVTTDQAMQNEAAAVVFDSSFSEKNRVPARKHNKQIYVWMSQESPFKSTPVGKNNVDLFNMTMTHRRDSDIYYPLYTTAMILREIETRSDIPKLSMLMRIKTKLIYWEPKTCGGNKVSRMALDIAYRLRVSGLRVDGGCWQKEAIPVAEKSRYKFYLALGYEWHCRDFIGREIWENALLVGVVPIIWGPSKGDLADLLPRNSYLVAEDFGSAFEVINYLQYLDREDSAYREYLKWRETPLQKLLPPSSLQFQEGNGFCQLCSTLHNAESEELYQVPSLHEWWYGSDSVFCTAPKSPARLEYFAWLRLYSLLWLDENFEIMNNWKTYNYWCTKILVICIVVIFYSKVWNSLLVQGIYGSCKRYLLRKLIAWNLIK